MNRVTSTFILGLLALVGCQADSPEHGENGPSLATAGIPSAERQTQGDRGGGPQESLVARRIWAGEGVDLSGHVSRDGRYLSFVDWATGDLAVRDLAAREDRRLTNKGSWAESTESAEGSAVSPDGQRVAYNWVGTGVVELRVIGMDGSGERTLLRDEFVEYVQPYGWTSDGRAVLVELTRSNDVHQIALLSVEDGSIKVLKTWDGGTEVWAGNVSLSPDGRWLAYDLPVEGHRDNRDIFVLATDGGGEHPLVRHNAKEIVLGWAPDGQHLLFASDRMGTLGAWIIEVEAGEAGGEAQLVKPDMWRVQPLGFTEDGAFFYGVNTSTRNVYVATVDLAAREVLAPPTPVGRNLGPSVRPRWSPDGSTLAFRTRRLGSEENLIALWSAETGEIREVHPRLGGFGWPLWARDGNFLLLSGRTDPDRSGLFRIDPQSGNAEPFPNFWGVNFAAPFDLSLNGEHLLTTVWLPDGGKAIQVRALEGGEVRTLHRGGPQGAALSPQGSRVAFVDFGEGCVTVNVVDAAGGATVELLRADEPGEDYPGSVTWSPDGTNIVFVHHPPEHQDVAEVLFLPVNGGNPEVGLELHFPTPVQGIRHLSFSPDGRRIAFEAGSGGSEVWVMENFLSGH